LRDDGAQIEGIIENAPMVPSPLQPTTTSFFYSSQIPPHIYLFPLPESSGQFREVWASPDGRFSSQQIPPGDYRILAFDRPQRELEYRNEEAMRNYHAHEQVMRLVAGQKQQLRLHMIAGSD